MNKLEYKGVIPISVESFISNLNTVNSLWSQDSISLNYPLEKQFCVLNVGTHKKRFLNGLINHAEDGDTKPLNDFICKSLLVEVSKAERTPELLDASDIFQGLKVDIEYCEQAVNGSIYLIFTPHLSVVFKVI